MQRKNKNNGWSKKKIQASKYGNLPEICNSTVQLWNICMWSAETEMNLPLWNEVWKQMKIKWETILLLHKGDIQNPELLVMVRLNDLNLVIII